MDVEMTERAIKESCIAVSMKRTSRKEDWIGRRNKI